jgi:hypothetical protein
MQGVRRCVLAGKQGEHREWGYRAAAAKAYTSLALLLVVMALLVVVILKSF